MASEKIIPKNFFGELKRRNVYKVAVAYSVAAWLVIQIATQVFPFFENTRMGGPAGCFVADSRFPWGADFGLGL